MHLRRYLIETADGKQSEIEARDWIEAELIMQIRNRNERIVRLVYRPEEMKGADNE